MAISTLAAVAIGAGALGSAAISKSATNKASKAAVQSADAAAAEQQAAREQAYSTLNPFTQGGVAANSQINALLGLNTAPAVQQSVAPAASFGGGFGGSIGNALQQFYAQQQGQTAQPAQPATQPGLTQNQAFDNFRNSTGYQFRLSEGMNALNSQYAGAGAIKSGAAVRDAVQFGQNFASGEFGNYLNALGNQQATGLQAGSAAAGVGVNAANSLGNIYQNRADGIGNAALINAGNMNSLIGTLGAGILRFG